MQHENPNVKIKFIGDTGEGYYLVKLSPVEKQDIKQDPKPEFGIGDVIGGIIILCAMVMVIYFIGLVAYLLFGSILIGSALLESG